MEPTDLSYKTNKRWFKQKNISENAIAVLTNLIRYKNIPVTELTIRETLLNHPSFPSIESLKDALLEWNIYSLPVFLKVNDLDEVDFPVIAHIKDGGDKFVLVTKIESDIIYFLDPSNGWQKLSINDFKKIWAGAMLLIASDNNSGDTNYKKNKRKQRIINAKLPFLLIIGCSLIFSSFALVLPTSSLSISWLSLLIIKIIGSTLSIFLIINEAGEINTLLLKICSINNTINCKSVLQSKSSRLFGWINLSEIGAFYFIGGFLTLVLSAISNNITVILTFLAIINLFALPYTFYSIWYQGIIIKKWCPLCVGVQVMLWLEFVILFRYIDIPKPVGLLTINTLVWGFMLPLIVWIVFRNSYFNSFQIKELKTILNKFRGDRNIFSKLLELQNKIDIEKLNAELCIGNPEAENTIIMVTNPNCNPCAKAHKEIKKLVSNKPDKFNVVYRFTSNMPVLQHVVNYLLTKENEKALEILDNWFEFKDIKKVIVNPDLNGNSDQISEILNKHVSWCNQSKITHTPTILLNGREIPEYYRINDLKYLVS